MKELQKVPKEMKEVCSLIGRYNNMKVTSTEQCSLGLNHQSKKTRGQDQWSLAAICNRRMAYCEAEADLVLQSVLCQPGIEECQGPGRGSGWFGEQREVREDRGLSERKLG